MRVLCLAVALGVAACSSIGSNDTVPVGASAVVARATADTCKGTCIGTCKGSDHSSITPCPITLTGEDGRKGIDVTMSAPGITWARPYKKRPCRVGGQGDHTWKCRLEPVGGKFVTEWRVRSGTSCGEADVLFKGYAGQELIANVYLPITNKACTRARRSDPS